MNTPSRDYWLSRDGAMYAAQQCARRSRGNQSYGMQEQWLRRFIASRAEALSRPIKVLDFGAGFGRMAHILSDYDFVDYYGFDISMPMVEPLLKMPPVRFAEVIGERVRVGNDVSHIFGGHRFDVIFTVSVLIHNDRDQAALAVAGMRSLLNEGGSLCLIENLPVSISILANLWHAGCWSHDIVGTVAPEMDVDIDETAVPDHGIYLMREPRTQQREIRVTGASGLEKIEEAEYLVRVHARTAAVVRGLEREIGSAANELAISRDRTEIYTDAEARAARVLSEVEGSFSEDILIEAEGGNIYGAIELIPKLAGALRSRDDALRRESMARQDVQSRAEEWRAEAASNAQMCERLLRQITLRERIGRLMQEQIPPVNERHLLRVSHGGVSADTSAVDVYELNATRDIRFAQPLEGHERVCHVVHQEWFGIRAAAGALPGQKLAVTAHAAPTPRDLEAVVCRLSELGVDKLVFHGFSRMAELWIRGLAAAGYEDVFLVWHGAPAMWVNKEERELIDRALQLARLGFIRRLHGMRPGTHLALGRAAWIPQIYNMPPNYRSRFKSRMRGERTIAFAPSWNLIHKNLFTNVAAAVAAHEIDEVWTLASGFTLPGLPEKEIKSLPKLDQVQMLETMELSSIVLNASIVDCHPMVELEALASGTPAVRGRLGLDALEDHEYIRLTQVSDPLSVLDIRSVIERVLRTPHDEIQDMMASYSKELVKLSFDRYSEMLGI